MPTVDGTLLSAGCAGNWYFDWISERTGHKSRHIGIEYYSPKPDALPTNVEWIANTVGNMSAVEDRTCDLVFSGQNIEHLWPEDVVGFFVESNRVLKDGGWFVIDSPNRLMTTPLNWSHPEHTIELTPAEAGRLAELAGFDVVSVKGLWTCRDAQRKEMLPLTLDAGDERWSLPERVAAAHDDPDNALIWWLTARKSGSARPAELSSYFDSIFAKAWPERKTRFLCGNGREVFVNGERVIGSDKNITGPILYGPYVPLKAGHHVVEFTLRAFDAKDPQAVVAECDVVGKNGRKISSKSISTADLRQLNGKLLLDFELDELEFGIQARCISLGTARLECELPKIDG